MAVTASSMLQVASLRRYSRPAALPMPGVDSSKLADVENSARRKARRQGGAQPIYPIALEVEQRIDALFDIERGINGLLAEERLVCRKERSAAFMSELHAWLTEQLSKLSRNHDLAKAINYMLRRWHAFTRFLGDGRICPTNNAAERALRGIALGRKSRLFCGSNRGCDIQPDRHRQAQRHRSPSLARRCPRPHRRAPRKPPERTAALELALPADRSHRLILVRLPPSPDASCDGGGDWGSN